MSDTTSIDTAWAELAALEQSDRIAAMTERLQALATEGDETRQSQLAGILAAEASLEGADVRAMTSDRLRAMAALDVEVAQSLAASFDKAELALPAAVSMKRVPMLQQACKSLSLDEVSHIERFMPSVRQLAGIPGGASPASKPGTTEATPEPAPQKRGLLARLFGRT